MIRRWFSGAILTLLGAICVAAQQPATARMGAEEAIKLSRFREMYTQARNAATPPAAQPKKAAPPPLSVDIRPADEAFLQVLTLQARVAAARQSHDRLAGWMVAIRPRIENQSIAAVDVEILTLAEKKAAADVARLDSDLRRAVAWANELVGRPKGSALTAAVDTTASNGPDAQGRAAMEKDVLVRGRDLLLKLFQSYTIGGGEITELLWYEAQAAETEENYRVWSAREAFDAAVAASTVQ
jgi:hypothetical protein